MKSKKAQLTKTGIIFSTFTFYAIIGVLMGFYGDSFGEENSQFSETKLEQLSTLGFLGDIIVGVDQAPNWLNAILFVPLGLMLSYLLITSLINGGA